MIAFVGLQRGLSHIRFGRVLCINRTVCDKQSQDLIIELSSSMGYLACDMLLIVEQVRDYRMPLDKVLGQRECWNTIWD